MARRVVGCGGMPSSFPRVCPRRSDSTVAARSMSTMLRRRLHFFNALPGMRSPADIRTASPRRRCRCRHCLRRSRGPSRCWQSNVRPCIMIVVSIRGARAWARVCGISPHSQVWLLYAFCLLPLPEHSRPRRLLPNLPRAPAPSFLELMLQTPKMRRLPRLT